VENAMNAMGLKRYKQLRAVIKSIQQGSPISSACTAAGINTATFWRWRVKNEKLDRLVNKIVDNRVQIVEDAVFNSAVTGDGRQQRYFLNNRSRDRWKNDSAIINNNVVTTVVQQNRYEGKTKEELETLANSFYRRREKIKT